MELEEFRIIYLSLAVFFGIWQGFFYYEWHPREHNIYSTEYWREILLNTMGSIIGWIVGYYLIFYRLVPNFPNLQLGASDFVLFLIFFYGANGRLPDVLVNRIFSTLDKLLAK